MQSLIKTRNCLIFNSNIIRRTFLSNSYKCTNEWESRLNSKYMEKIKLDNLYFDIDQSFNHLGKASAIDIDIFTNRASAPALKDEIHLKDEIINLLHKLRLTEETSNALDSTSHSVIRNFIDSGHINELLTILDDRLNFGIFLDNYIANYAMDILIKNKDYRSASRISVQMMLQEDFTNEITKSLSLYACFKYLHDLKPSSPIESMPANEEEKKEEVKIRVKFIRNEFFDQHFDIKNDFHLIGKTLILIATTLDDELKLNVTLLGNVLLQKYDEATELLRTANSLNSDAIKLSLKILKDQNVDENEGVLKLKTLLESYSKQNNKNLENEITELVKEFVKKNENTEVEKQKKLYLEWNKLRDEKINEEITRLDRAKRLKEIEKLTNEMNIEEQKLWYFENKDKIDLLIDSKKVTYPKRWFGKKKKPKVIDEGYIPPEIIKHRN